MPVLKPARGIQLNKSHPLARGLVGCWLSNEGSGDKVFDLSGYGNHGEMTNVTWAAGFKGTVLHFGGTNNRVEVLNAGIDQSKTMIICGRSAGGTYCRLFAQNQALNVRLGYQLRTTGTETQIELRNNFSEYSVTATIALNQWYVFGCVCDYEAGDAHLYIDGLLANSDTSATFDQETGAHLYFGCRGDSGWWNGDIVYALQFGRALSAAEIVQLYREPFCMFQPVVRPGLLFIDSGQAVSLAGTLAGQSTIYITAKATRKISGQVFSLADLTAAAKRTRKALGSLAATATAAGSLKSTLILAAGLSALADLSGLLSLPEQIVLVGTISAAATLLARPASCFNWPWFGGSLQIETEWLREALFHGMTANAYKLGTMLSLGWFWVRRSGCSGLFRGLSMEQIDCVNLLAAADRDACLIQVPGCVPHDRQSTCYYVVRRFNSCGHQEHTLAAAIMVSIDSSGDLEKPQPNGIFAWSAQQVDGNKVQLVWFYCPVGQDSKPACFKIYCDSGTGQIDYESPLATVNYRGQRFHDYQTDVLAAKRYRFALRVEDADGVQDSSLEQLRIQLATASPEPAGILSANPV